MTTTPRSRRANSNRKGDANEQALLETAQRLLQDTPLSDISVEMLARGAGISRSSFYFYFGSKEDLLLALVDRMTGELESAVRAVTESVADDPRARITEGIEATADLWREHGPVLHAVAAAAATDPGASAMWGDTLARFVDVNTQMIEAERARGAATRSGPSARELATALVWLNERVLGVQDAGAGPAPAPERVVPVLTEVWLRAIYGEAA